MPKSSNYVVVAILNARTHALALLGPKDKESQGHHIVDVLGARPRSVNDSNLAFYKHVPASAISRTADGTPTPSVHWNSTRRKIHTVCITDAADPLLQQ